MRTTVDIDTPILKELKMLGAAEGKTLGRVVSDLLLEALSRRKDQSGPKRAAQWIAKPMGAKLDLADREAVYDAMARERRDLDDGSRP